MNEVTTTTSDDPSFLRRAGKYGSTGAEYESNTYGREHLQHYRDLRNEVLGELLQDSFPDKRPLSILDVGCGTGLVLEFVSSLDSEHSLFGIDGCETMLNQAKARFETIGRPATFQLASCENLPFDAESLDVVIATRFIHLFTHAQKQSIYKEFRRVLRPGGVAIVEYYSRPFAWLRYHFAGEKKKKPRENYFSHYPTQGEVREIVGGPFRRHPVRLAGTRLLVRLLGERVVRRLTLHTPFPQKSPFVDEYLVVTRK